MVGSSNSTQYDIKSLKDFDHGIKWKKGSMD